MSFKKSIGLGFISAMLGISLIGGGTYAAFTSEAVSENSFTAGIISLELDEPVIFDLSDFKPGDTITRDFVLENTGNMTIGAVHLLTDYEVIDANGDNGKVDIGDYIEVEYLINDGPSGQQTGNEVIKNRSLSHLKDTTFQRVAEYKLPRQSSTRTGISAGEKHYLRAKIKFIDTDAIDQNIFQGDEIKFKWTFKGFQQNGTSRSNENR